MRHIHHKGHSHHHYHGPRSWRPSRQKGPDRQWDDGGREDWSIRADEELWSRHEEALKRGHGPVRGEHRRGQMHSDWDENHFGSAGNEFVDVYRQELNPMEHMRTHQYVGRGPKGWRRSDESIRNDACEALARDPLVDASEIEVQVSEGVVTLSGHVEDRFSKHRAEDSLEGIRGLKDVQNELRVDPSLFPSGRERMMEQSS